MDSKYVMSLMILGSILLFLFILSIVFALFNLNEKNKISTRIKDYKESFYKETLKDIQNSKTTRNIYDSLELLLARSQLKYNYSWNVPLFLILLLNVFFYAYFSTLKLLDGVLTSLIIAGISTVFPIILVEFMATLKGKKLKSQILSLIPVLINNAKLTNGDIFRTMKESSEKVKVPMNMYLQEFVDEYEHGVPQNVCFNNLRYKISDFRFTRIIDCLENHLYKGGNVVVTLSSINKEYQAREVEEDRKKKQNAGTAMGIYIAVAGNVLILWIINLVMPELIVTIKGKDWLLSLIILNISISLFIGYIATRSQMKENS